MAKRIQKARAVRRAHAGAVLVEYTLVLAFVAVPTVIGIGLGGVGLLNAYTAQRNALMQVGP